MARGPAGLPKPAATTTTKTALIQLLKKLDQDTAGVQRVLKMETDFRKRISAHVKSLPLEDAVFAKFNTNPFVLLMHSLKQKYKHVSQIERDILPAKLFSSMETSAGRMIEQVVLPIYGWEYAPSEMGSSESVIDGKQTKGKVLRLASLKSGPRCLNDEMSKDIAGDIVKHVPAWGKLAGVKEIEFTYGVLYGTKKASNKKDWHILRNIAERTPAAKLLVKPNDRWDCKFIKDGITVTVNVRIGIELWNYFADDGQAFFEVACAIIRACVTPSDTEAEDYTFTIKDLKDIISLDPVPETFNVSVLQRSQWEWFFFFVRHFYDVLGNS
jgi:Type II restriction endonuclease EcoO109I